MSAIQSFVSGLLTMGFLVAAAFFLRFWSRSRDVLFLAFAAAFCLLGVQQAILGLRTVPHEVQSWSFLIRLAAFICIAAVVIHRNIGRSGRR